MNSIRGVLVLSASLCIARDVSAQSTRPSGEETSGSQSSQENYVVREGRRVAAALLLLSSACHGIEGFCGSGVQVALLQSPAWHARVPRWMSDRNKDLTRGMAPR